MKQITKYKFLNKFKSKIRVSTRVLNFKRPKWNNTKKLYLKLNYFSKLLDVYKQNVLLGWEKVKKNFKNEISMKRYLLLMHNNDKRKRAKLLRSKFINKSDKLNNYYLKRFFEIDFFLYSIYLFNSIYSCKNFVQSGIITKNDKIHFNFVLKKGDVIKVEEDKYKFQTIKERFSSIDEGINSIYEYDYYTQSFVILKSFSELNKKDMYLINTNFL